MDGCSLEIQTDDENEDLFIIQSVSREKNVDESFDSDEDNSFTIGLETSPHSDSGIGDGAGNLSVEDGHLSQEDKSRVHE